MPPAFTGCSTRGKATDISGSVSGDLCTLSDTARVSSKHGFGTAEAALNEERAVTEAGNSPKLRPLPAGTYGRRRPRDTAVLPP